MEYYVRRQDVLEGEDYTQPYPVQVDDPRAVSVRDFFQAAGAGMCFSLDRYYPAGPLSFSAMTACPTPSTTAAWRGWSPWTRQPSRIFWTPRA